jgi:hypothetical protein
MTTFDVILAIARILDHLGIAYMIGGSVASSVHGRLRTTQDADFVIDLSPGQIEPLMQSLAQDFYVSRDAMREAVRDRRSFNAIHTATSFKVDLFILGNTPYDVEAFGRRSLEKLDDSSETRLVLSRPEDSVLHKLQWYRMGGEVSEQQWRDVLGVLQVQEGRLDEAYLDRWAAQLGVSDLLAKVRREAAGN